MPFGSEVEALLLALGWPVISTYIAGVPELVKTQVTGWPVPVGDEVALAKVMREPLNLSIDQLATVGLLVVFTLSSGTTLSERRLS